MIRQTNKTRRHVQFNVGDYVWLSRDVLYFHNPIVKNRFKLSSRYIGPYKIKREINPSAFELDLPSDMNLHPVFHVSELKPYNAYTYNGNEEDLGNPNGS